jgi:uncharacterized protein
MKRFRIAIIVFVSLTGVVRADGPATSTRAAAKHFLWKVKSKTATVYLLGSVHAAKKELYPLDAVITSAFKASDKIVFEVPMDFKTQLEAATKMFKASQYAAGDSLNKHLDKETKRRLDAYLERAKLPAAAFSRFRPWFVAVNIVLREVQSSGYSLLQGVDQHFLKQAQAAKMPILGLETVDDQVGIFKSLDGKTQLKMLKQALDEAAKTRETLDKTFKAWKAGDAKALDDLMLKPMRAPEYKTLYKTLFLDRNAMMAKKIEGYLATDKTYFVIIGAGHLVGKGSVVDRLKATKTFSVEQE